MTETESPFIRDGDWESDWDSHARWQLAAGLAATPAQRLAWLEDMMAFALHAGALPRAQSDE